MKPSPLFADNFRFFFKRFYKDESLFRWFLKKVGVDSSSFSYPDNLCAFKKTIVFLPNSKEEALQIIKTFKDLWKKESTLIVADASLQELLIHYPIAKKLFLSEKEFRYGELAFEKAKTEIITFAPELCLYLSKPFLPALYLAKSSNATCRLGFQVSELYPFLNISLQASSQNEQLTLLLKQYGVNNGG